MLNRVLHRVMIIFTATSSLASYLWINGWYPPTFKINFDSWNLVQKSLCSLQLRNQCVVMIHALLSDMLCLIIANGRAHAVGKTKRAYTLSPSHHCWLETIKYPEGPSFGHLDTGFLFVFCLHANTEMFQKLQAPTACVTCSLPGFNQSKWSSYLRRHPN